MLWCWPLLTGPAAVMTPTCDVHCQCPACSTDLTTLRYVESNYGARRSGGRRVETDRATGLSYDLSETGGYEHPPRGWRAVTSIAVVGTGAEVCDELAEELLDFTVHRRAGVRVVKIGADGPDDQGTAVDALWLDGPMRGPCRRLGRTDESLRQGLVVGTLEGNRVVAEHRCLLEVDPVTEAVEATVRTFWRPATGRLLPGADVREARAFQRMADRVVWAFGSLGIPTA